MSKNTAKPKKSTEPNSTPDSVPNTVNPTENTNPPQPMPTPTPTSYPAPTLTPEPPHRKETTLIAVIIVLSILIIFLIVVIVFGFVMFNSEDNYYQDDPEIIYIDQEDESDYWPENDNKNQDEKTESYTSLLLTPERALNYGDYRDGFVANIVDSSGNISVRLESIVKTPACRSQQEKSKVWLYLDWDDIKKMYPHIEITKSGRESIAVENIDADKITDVLVSGFGQAVGDETVFFLMADGTVEYLPLAKSLKDGKIKSYGKLPNVKDIIKFYKGDITSGCMGGGLNVYAQRSDGKFYDLYDIITTVGVSENYR